MPHELIFGTVLLALMINSSPKSQRKKIVISLVLAFFLSILVYVNRNSSPVVVMQGIVQSIFSIPKSRLYAMGKSEGKDDPRLVKKIQELEKKMVDYQLLKQDNAALRNQFQISGETSQNLVAAKIVGFQGSSKNPQEFIINVGEKNGIKKGMTVMFEKYFIGKIENVSKNFSVVTTPYNQKLRVLAKYPETNANGILIGQKDFMLFDGVVITDALKKEGIVVTKGEVDRTGVGVVPDLIIGKIASISKNETAPFQSAEIIPMINYSSLSNIFVISQM